LKEVREFRRHLGAVQLVQVAWGLVVVVVQAVHVAQGLHQIFHLSKNNDELIMNLMNNGEKKTKPHRFLDWHLS
jgi:hypothetical protein